MSDDGSLFDSAVIAAHRGARALVTGGTGFVGTHLCNLLQKSGWTVWSVSRRATGPAFAHRHWQVDLADAGATTALVKSTRPDYVFHLAGHVWVATGLDVILPTFQSNLYSTVNLLHALAGTNCRRVVVAGSQIEPDERAGEAVPNIPYALSKWASSEYVRMFHRLYQVPGVIARIFYVYGPGQNVSKLIPYVIGCVSRSEVPKLTSGRSLADWIYVDDVAHGLARMAVAPIAPGCTIDLGSGSLITTVELVHKIYELLETDERPVFGALPDRSAERARAARIDETRRQLGWSPRVSLSDGLLRTIGWFRAASEKQATPAPGLITLTKDRQ
jgi:UDP-glucose 4-epimerase